MQQISMTAELSLAEMRYILINDELNFDSCQRQLKGAEKQATKKLIELYEPNPDKYEKKIQTSI